MANRSFTIDLGGLGLFMLIILFWGEPDLMGAVIGYIQALTQACK